MKEIAETMAGVDWKLVPGAAALHITWEDILTRV